MRVLHGVLWWGVVVGMLAGLLSGCVHRDARAGDSDSPTFMREGDFMACADGYKFSIVENAVFRPGGDDVMVVVNGVRIEDGVMKAHLWSGAETSGVGAGLMVGEAVAHPGVGTYTLLDVVPRSRPAGQDGGGGQASFCFEPEPGFVLDRESFGLPDDDSQSAG